MKLKYMSNYRCNINWKQILSKHSFLEILSQRQQRVTFSPVNVSDCWQDMKDGFVSVDHVLIWVKKKGFPIRFLVFGDFYKR